MTNYILIYRFEDKAAEGDFLRKLEKEYPDHQLDIRHDIPYFAFAAREIPAVEGRINGMIDEINVDTTDTDYVALFYIKEEAPNKIKQNMILGSADLPETDLKRISSAEHENLLEDMFNIDFMKLRFQQK